MFGAAYADGGIIGPPAWKADTTRLYVPGRHASAVAALFSEGVLSAVAIPQTEGNEVAASALKMAYAAYSKGHSALLLAANALAHNSGVLQTLHDEWDLSMPGMVKRSEATAQAISPKAWRFVGEMEQISATSTTKPCQETLCWRSAVVCAVE